MKVLITSNSFGSCDKGPLELLEKEGFEIIRNPYGRLLEEDELIELLEDVDAVILGTDPLSERVIRNAKKLKIVSRYGVGIDNVDREALERAGIKLTTTPNANTDSVADHAVGLMLSVAHNITKNDRLVRKGVWKKGTGKDLYKSTVGIIGLGAIGRAVAQRLKGFDCNILAYDVVYDEDFVSEYGIKKAELEEIYREADFITLHIPALDKPILDDEAFETMKDGVIIINTARAEVIDRDALLRALKNKKIYGVGLDVHYNEPNIDREFLECDDVILTPHCAASAESAINNMSYLAAKNVIDFFKTM
ncbi:phosphoglycerate dehydrogenase [Tepidimicrobium xylanilyticum]|uniref:phosphoglycerate dehydrogenase n=1 Tax=Tepidimicrobium xylanilyticum TaxID=1123352 RepID=UPI002650304C|nr:phosphoglycerate dehydrogenase [Tepidimicrobium xylanilyticum]GMG95360.1 D-lactate dehydrogenase [Tepidimicrobium xylanilyticum]